ncbi:MAG: hypothetical protein GTO46_16305 [Gemmatimonadetes bacterium]|nr:hypothetical protein [Gemmatimonadota bacterium]NIO33271.1 hypothetical protein [Gemmatimonadota bacterium]
MPGIDVLELIGGGLAILGIFTAFMVWAIFPLLPFILMGTVYALIRYGVPALGRAALAVEHGTIAGVRWILHPLAVWALRGPEPATARYGDGRGRRR